LGALPRRPASLFVLLNPVMGGEGQPLPSMQPCSTSFHSVVVTSKKPLWGSLEA